jgi:hypothetical protein
MEHSSAVACVQVAETEHHEINVSITRRTFLTGVAVSSLAVPAAGSAQPLPPAYEDLTRYYAFLWSEFINLSKEMGVAMCDRSIADMNGDSAALRGHLIKPPSTRANAVMRMVGADRTSLPSTAWQTSPAPLQSDDALLALISAYRRGTDPDSSDFCEEEFSAATKALNAWNGPAPSRASALAALELAQDEYRDFTGSPTAAAMIGAAIRFIEAR